MMQLRHFTLAAALLAAASASAQLTPDQMKRSKEIIGKARQVDLLHHILPLVMSKDQMSKLLTVLEKCRAKEIDIEKREANELRQIEQKIDQALDRAIKDGQIPSVELLRELNQLLTAFTMRRAAVSEENTDDVLKVLKAEFNAGQLKSATGSINPKLYDPSLDPAKMTEDEKLRFFIKAVLLDWSAYDVLVKMSQRRT